MDIKTKLRVGFWNVRTMFESTKTTQIIQEMKVYKLHILGISECRWTGFGENKTGTGETILYSGRDDNQHSAGVALILKNGMNKHLIEWQPVNERIMTARFNGRYAKLYIIQCYAPTNEAEEEDKEAFYRRLQEIVDKVPAHDVLCIMGDLNAKVGNNNRDREAIMGREGCGNMNENGEMLINFCMENRLVIGGTIFPHKNIHKLTWISPNGRSENQIDHFMINKRWQKSLLDVKVKRGADVGSDHHLIIALLRLKLKKGYMKNRTIKSIRFNVDRLKEEKIATQFSVELKNKFKVLTEPANPQENPSIQEKLNLIKES